MSGPTRRAVAVLGGCVAFFLAPAPALASFHLMSVREVFPGTGVGFKNEYVELQMYAAGQNQVQLGTLKLYGANGTVTNPTTPSGPVPISANQSTVLFATSSAEQTFGFTADVSMTNLDALDPAGGAVCWATVDCVSWGNFNNTSGTPLPSPTGSPAVPSGGITGGMALLRSIAPNCSTILEASDDSNNSATDFGLAAPNPRTNSSPITESPCASTGGGGGTGDNKPPNTKIGKIKVSGTTATVKFSGTDTARVARASGLTFKCKLDKKKFKSCKSPKKFKHLKPGKHKVQVEAIDAAGNVDPSPARKKFHV